MNSSTKASPDLPRDDGKDTERTMRELGKTDADALVVDPIVETVREKLHHRSQVGIRKYGVTMMREDLTFIEWVIHLQQELLDAAVYAQKLIEEAKK